MCVSMNLFSWQEGTLVVGWLVWSERNEASCRMKTKKRKKKIGAKGLNVSDFHFSCLPPCWPLTFHQTAFQLLYFLMLHWSNLTFCNLQYHNICFCWLFSSSICTDSSDSFSLIVRELRVYIKLYFFPPFFKRQQFQNCFFDSDSTLVIHTEHAVQVIG